jgi:hypothetical protein
MKPFMIAFDFSICGVLYLLLSPLPMQSMHVPVAQLDRAFDYESKGREFESLRARHIIFLLAGL